MPLHELAGAADAFGVGQAPSGRICTGSWARRRTIAHDHNRLSRSCINRSVDAKLAAHLHLLADERASRSFARGRTTSNRQALVRSIESSESQCTGGCGLLSNRTLS